MSRPSGSLRRLVLLACAAALLAPAAARADDGQPFADPVLDQYLQLSSQHWNAPPPACLQVYLFDDPDPSVASRAQQPGCKMWLDRDYFKPPLRPDSSDCAIIVHEFGHLLGHAHSSDPHDVMFETAPPDGAPECAFFEASARKASAQRVAKRRKAKRRRTHLSRLRHERAALRHKRAALRSKRGARVVWQAF